MAKQIIKANQIDWSSFSANIKSAQSTTTGTPVNGSNVNLASTGVAVTFTVATACVAFVTVGIAVVSTTDFENKPLIYLDGGLVAGAGYNAAAGNASSRTNPRPFSSGIAIPAGTHTLSAGIVVSSASSPSVPGGGANISVIILGNVTA